MQREGGVVAAISFDCADGNRRTDGTVDRIVVVLAQRRGATRPRPPSPPLVLVPPSRDAARSTNRPISPSLIRRRTISDRRSVLAKWEDRNEDKRNVDGNGPARLLRLSNPGLTLPFEFQRRPVISSTSTTSDGRSVLVEWEDRNEDDCNVDGNGPARLLRRCFVYGSIGEDCRRPSSSVAIDVDGNVVHRREKERAPEVPNDAHPPCPPLNDARPGTRKSIVAGANIHNQLHRPGRNSYLIESRESMIES